MFALIKLFMSVLLAD